MPKGLNIPARHWLAVVMTSALMGTALISPLFPLYQEAWKLSAAEISNIYVIYMIGAFFGLVVLGRMGDRIGFVATLTVALGLAFTGSLLCIVAKDLPVLYAGRFMVGVAATMSTSSGVAGLAILAPEHLKGNVGLKSSLIVAFGFGIGPVIGGIAGQWSSLPLVVAHLPSLVMLVIGLIILSQMKPRLPLAEIRTRLDFADFMPKLTWPKGRDGVTFTLACILPFITFGVFGLYASMAPTIISKVLGLGGPLVSGLGIATILAGSCTIQILFRHLSYNRSALLGLSLLATSSLIMMINLHLGLASLFAIGLVVTATGHGLCILSGTIIVNMIADNTNRASLNASYWAVGYSGSIIPMIGTGIMSDLWGMTVSVTVFCLCTVALCLTGAGLFIAVRTARRRAMAEAI